MELAEVKTEGGEDVRPVSELCPRSHVVIVEVVSVKVDLTFLKRTLTLIKCTLVWLVTGKIRNLKTPATVPMCMGLNRRGIFDNAVGVGLSGEGVMRADSRD